MENPVATQPHKTATKPSETSTEEEDFQEVIAKRGKKKKVPAASLRNAKNAKETSANKHALNETTWDNTKRKSPIIRAHSLDDVKVKDNQVLFYNFPKDTPIVSMLAFLNKRGVNTTSSACSLVSMKQDLPAVMVDFDNADTAYVQTILVHDRKCRSILVTETDMTSLLVAFLVNPTMTELYRWHTRNIQNCKTHNFIIYSLLQYFHSLIHSTPTDCN